MSERAVPSVEQDHYWQEMQQLRLDAIYVRDYRDSIAKMETTVAAIRAVASSGSIGAWVIWRQYASVWAALIAISQIVDALRDVCPVRKRRHALSSWCNSLNRLFVDAQRDWDDISAGALSNRKIAGLTHHLRQKMQRYEQTYIPDGLPKRQEIFDKAQVEMEIFFRNRYSIDEDE